jgi:hypothetical protein
MKKLILCLLLTGSSIFAQNKSAIFGDDIVWYGIDYSKAKFVGEFSNFQGTAQKPEALIKQTIPQWNMVVLNEGKKYDIGKFFKKKNVFNDLTPVTNQNSAIDETKITSFNEYKFDNADEAVAKMVSGYSGGEKTEGLGLVFITESYDKTKEAATYYLTFFDIKTKQVVYAEKITEKPGGIGLKNYWASTIIKVMKDVEDSRYGAWKSKFGKK